MLARERIVFPLDVSTLDEARVWITRLRNHVGVFKVGLELFVAEGPRAVEVVHEAGALCFLDLKLHDIPATMASAVRVSVKMDVRFLTVHGSAGPVALLQCANAAAGSATELLAVTVLTSMSQDETHALGWANPMQQAQRLAAIAQTSGIKGIVCSPEEVATLRAAHEQATLVVPGIRPHGSVKDDQTRIATAEQAMRDGADFLVVGRPIRNAADPIAAAQQIAIEIETGARERFTT